MKLHPINTIYTKQNICFKNDSVEKKYTESLSCDAVFSYLNAIGSYNVSFSAIKTQVSSQTNETSKQKTSNTSSPTQQRAIYAIDKEGNYFRYSSIKEASREIGVSDSNIGKCLKGTQKTSYGFVYAYAEDIEDIDEAGNVVVNQSKLDEKVAECAQNYVAVGKVRPIYAINKDGTCTKYATIVQAAEDLGGASANIGKCLKGEQKTAYGCVYTYADELEFEDENGLLVIDEKKLRKKVLECRRKLASSPNNDAIYAIDKDGNYTKYSTTLEAAAALGGSGTNISKCLNGKQKTAYGCVYIHAQELEKIDEDGNVTINKRRLNKKIKEIQDSIASLPQIRPFYAVDSEGNYTKFEKKGGACKALNVRSGHVSKCLEKERSTTGGYAFVYADEVEQIDEDGKVVVNINIPLEIYGQRTHIPIYSISDSGTITRFASKGEAARCLSVQSRNIDACLSGERETTGGHSFVKAEDVEVIDESNNVSLEKSIVDEKFNQAIKRSLYVINRYGKYKRFSSSREAAEFLKTTQDSVIFCSNGAIRSINGCKVIKAVEIESLDQNNEVIINNDLIKQYAKEATKLAEAAKRKSRKIVAIDSNGVETEFKNTEFASKVLGVSTDHIYRCLSGERKTANGYGFKYDIESMFSRRAKFYGKIYSIDRNEQFKEFENIIDASKQLGIDINELVRFLEQGTTSDGKTVLNGYVFAAECDE